MSDFIKITDDDGDKKEPVIINLEQVISISLLTSWNKQQWLNIRTTGKGSEGIIVYQVKDPGYATYLFNALNDRAIDLSWEYYLSQIEE